MNITKESLDELWANIIKIRAKYHSEYSGKPGKKAGGSNYLHAHHIAGKDNLRLRYMELDNGICLTDDEHEYIAHNEAMKEHFRKRVKEIRGSDIYDRLKLLKKGCHKTDYCLIRTFLLQEKTRLLNNE